MPEAAPTKKVISSSEPASLDRLPRSERPPQRSPFDRVVHPPGWDDDEPIFDLRGLRPEIATAIITQHVLGRHFWARLTLRGFSAAKYARKIGLPARDLWTFFNGHRVVRFSTICALYRSLPPTDWPDWEEINEEVDEIRKRSLEWMARQK